MKPFLQHIGDAIKLRLTDRPSVASTLAELHGQIPYGKNAVLIALLDSTVGGTVAVDGVMLSATSLVEGVSDAEKDLAFTLLHSRLNEMRDLQIQAQAVSLLITKLQTSGM